MVGSLAGTDTYFRTGVANSHFGTGGDGTIYQWVDTDYQSWANLNGNPNVISIENADMGSEFGPWSGSDVPAFTDAQIDAIARICAWAHDTHGIPLELIPDDRPGRRGVGYHRHGIDDWRVPAGVLWSSHRGKVCPGDRRIAQVPQIIARAKQITSGTPTPAPVEDDDMPQTLQTTDTKRQYVVDGLDMWKETDQEVFGSYVAAAGPPHAVNQRQADVLRTRKSALRAALIADVAKTISGGEIDPKALSAALAPALVAALQGKTGGMTQADVEAALRKVLGSLDNAPA